MSVMVGLNKISKSVKAEKPSALSVKKETKTKAAKPRRTRTKKVD